MEQLHTHQGGEFEDNHAVEHVPNIALRQLGHEALAHVEIPKQRSESSQVEHVVEVRAYGGDPARPVGPMPFADTFTLVPEEDLGAYFFIQTLTAGQHVVVLENNGWVGAQPDTARHVTEGGGQFFSVQWSPVASRIVQAVDGKLLADFEPLFTDRDGSGELVPQWAHEAVFAADGLRAAMLEALEQQTGLAFDRAWLEAELPIYRVPDPDGA